MLKNATAAAAIKSNTAGWVKTIQPLQSHLLSQLSTAAAVDQVVTQSAIYPELRTSINSDHCHQVNKCHNSSRTMELYQVSQNLQSPTPMVRQFNIIRAIIIMLVLWMPKRLEKVRLNRRLIATFALAMRGRTRKPVGPRNLFPAAIAADQVRPMVNLWLRKGRSASTPDAPMLIITIETKVYYFFFERLRKSFIVFFSNFWKVYYFFFERLRESFIVFFSNFWKV